jgi:hypothetical protein
MNEHRRLAGYSVAVGSLAFLSGAALAADLQPRLDASAPTTNRVCCVPFAGVDFAPESYFGYGGAVVALNGDFARPGFVVRVLGGYGEFRYNSESVAGGVVDGSIFLGDALVGYQAFGNNFRIAAYLGVEHQDIRLRPPDPTALVQGRETGFKILGEVETGEAIQFYFNLMGSFSTAFDTYWSRLRIGYRFGNLIVGPEGLLQGNRSSDVQRVGGFATYNWDLGAGRKFVTTAYGGYLFNENGGGPSPFGTRDGPYGGFVLAVVF